MVKSEKTMTERKIEDVARIEHALLDALEMRHHAECGDRLRRATAWPTATSRFVTGGQPARIRKRQITTETMKLTTWLRVIAEVMATDREISAGHEQAADVAGEDHAVIRIAEIVHGDHDREGEHQREAEQQPTRRGIFRRSPATA